MGRKIFDSKEYKVTVIPDLCVKIERRRFPNGSPNFAPEVVLMPECGYKLRNGQIKYYGAPNPNFDVNIVREPNGCQCRVVSIPRHKRNEEKARRDDLA